MNSTGPGDGEQALDAPRVSSETTVAATPANLTRPHTRLAVAGFVLVAMLAEILRVAFAYKRITFDAGNYQFYTGYAEIHGYGSVLSLPGGIESFLDPQINTLYYLLLTYLPPRLAVSSIAALQSLSVALLGFLVWSVARRVSSSFYMPVLAGLVAAAGAYLAPLAVIEAGATSSDALLAVLVFAAAALLYQVLETPVGRQAYIKASAAGVIIGVDGELKFTQAAFGLALIAGFVLALLTARPPSSERLLKQSAALTTAVVVPAVVVGAALYLPEAIFLWHRLRDPVFPFYNGLFNSPYIKPGNYNPGFVARTPSSLWDHFTQLFVGGADAPNGFYQLPLRSTVFFFSLIIVFLAFLGDIVRRTRPKALFVEGSYVLGFFLWAVMFGFYRYVAPLEMSGVAAVILAGLLHWPDRRAEAASIPRRHDLRHLGALLGLTALLAVGAVFSTYSHLGHTENFGTSYFEVPSHSFSGMAGDGVVLAGAPVGYLVPYIPPSAEIVSVGGNAEEIMSRSWWQHVKLELRGSHRHWWLIGARLSLRSRAHYLRQIGFPPQVSGCRYLSTVSSGLQVCKLQAPI